MSGVQTSVPTIWPLGHNEFASISRNPIAKFGQLASRSSARMSCEISSGVRFAVNKTHAGLPIKHVNRDAMILRVSRRRPIVLSGRTL
jgi:hypothetical protein